MVKSSRDLKKLEQVARLKAEIELKKFAAFSNHMTAARARVDSLQVALTQCYQSVAPLTLSDARIANAQAGRSARELDQAHAELARMQPRFDAARQVAAREFGRAEALYDLSIRLTKPRDSR